jgi:regulator of sigma E protease
VNEVIVIQLFLTILIALIIFGVIIVVHELGHFIMAKLMGVKVNEFAMGMGPKLLQFGKGETKYTLRAFPIGGFCAMEGEDSAGSGEVELSGKADGTEHEAAPQEEPEEPDPRAFSQKKVWRRMLIIIAGPVMNIVLGFLLLLVYFGACIVPNEDGKVYFGSTTVSSLQEGASDKETGLRKGDTILKLDGKTVFTDRDLVMILNSADDDVFDMVVSREVEGKKEKVVLKQTVFNWVNSENSGYSFTVSPIEQTFGSVITQSAKMECTVSVMIWRSLGDILTGKYGLRDLSGPVGTVDAIGDTVSDAIAEEHWQDGLGNILMMVVLITVNVGIFNLLPVPALDGGRLLFLIWEGITRKPVPPKYEGMIHAIGLVLLLLLIVVVTFSDIMKLFGA